MPHTQTAHVASAAPVRTQAPHARPLVLARAGMALLLALLAACGDEKKPAPVGTGSAPGDAQRADGAASSADATRDAADTLARERVAAFVAKDLKSAARDALAPLVARADATAEDLIRAAAIEYSDNRADEARRHLDRAEKLDPNSAAVAFLRGQMAKEAGEYDAARAFLRRAHERAPKDLATTLVLGAVEDDAGNVAEAERLYREVVAVGFENGQQWYSTAVYRLANLMSVAGRDADAEPFRRVSRDLERRGVKTVTPLQMMLGELGRVRPPPPSGTRVADTAAPAFRAENPVMPELAGATMLLAVDVDDDLATDLVACGPRGAFAALRRASAWRVLALTTEACTRVTTFDADNDGDLDVLVERAGAFALLEYAAESFRATKVVFPALPGVSDVVAVDYDHEGDLDLVFTGTFGARVLRRDGTPELEKEKGGALYVDATAESGLPTSKPVAWCVTEDFDGDNDVDLLLGTTGAPVVLDSLRGGRFQALENVFQTPSAARPLVADLDGDARTDLWVLGTSAAPNGTFAPRGKPARAGVASAVADDRSWAAADFDRDGALDLAFLDAQSPVEGGSAWRIVLAAGLANERLVDVKSAGRGPVAAGDFDGDGRVDLVCAAPTGVSVFTNQGPVGTGVRVSLRGERDNRRAVGTIVEVRAGDVYRRVYTRGEPFVVGLGTAQKFDVFRTTWPNGVGDTELDRAADARREDGTPFFDHVPQPSGQIGSCPFLYTWNGSTYTFVSDVLGITPLGLPMMPGMLVPPDHDEYVLVTGEQMVAKDGAFEMQFTEELREVTYLDHARLLVVDHPIGTEIFPNERFTFPPFPAPHTHTVRAPLAPKRATGSDGRDWTASVSAIDDAHAVPFTLHAPQFAGLARPWFVELEFDREAVAAARSLRLVMTGWFFWSDASANMAGARNPESPFVPPILQVPDGQGGWTDAGPPVGFPAGKTKSMVIDVGGILKKDDPRIRVFTTLRLYWDALRLATDADDAPLTVRELACSGAKLWRRGFSAPLDPLRRPGWTDQRDMPERFDWNVLAVEPRWNQHPGLYTRYGEVRELLDTVDDRFVILGAGDALTLSFAARDLPPPAAGLRRDYLVYLDGWAKDRDPNSIQALEVEPLPFHGMSGYPYRADERFPDGPVHRAWRAEWNTRPAWNWIQPVAPVRELEWLMSVPKGP